jgi:hypothetical protein
MNISVPKSVPMIERAPPPLWGSLAESMSAVEAVSNVKQSVIDPIFSVTVTTID